MLLLGLHAVQDPDQAGGRDRSGPAVPGAAEAVTGSINVKAALACRDWMTSDWDDSGQVLWLDSKGIALVRGRGRLTGERTVEVEPRGGGDARRLTAHKAVVLATGTSPLIPPIDGLADARPWDNRDVTEAKQLPRRLLVLGGGAVGTEMAQCYRRLGCEEVTVIEGAERLWPARNRSPATRCAKPSRPRASRS